MGVSMEGLRVLLEEQRMSSGSPVEALGDVLEGLHLQEDVRLTEGEHQELAQLVAQYGGEDREAVHGAYLSFYLQFMNTSTTLSNDSTN